MMKMLKHIKMYCRDHINDNSVYMLVDLKEILTKIHFCTPPELLALIYTTYTQHTDFIFSPNLVPSKVSRQ